MKKAIKKVDKFTGALGTLKILAGLDDQPRDDVFRTKWDNIIVDTVVAFDTGTWETGINTEPEGDYVIVEQYENKDEAKKGHYTWINKLRDNPKMELKDLDLWNLEI